MQRTMRDVEIGDLFEKDGGIYEVRRFMPDGTVFSARRDLPGFYSAQLDELAPAPTRLLAEVKAEHKRNGRKKKPVTPRVDRRGWWRRKDENFVVKQFHHVGLNGLGWRHYSKVQYPDGPPEDPNGTIGLNNKDMWNLICIRNNRRDALNEDRGNDRICEMLNSNGWHYRETEASGKYFGLVGSSRDQNPSMTEGELALLLEQID